MKCENCQEGVLVDMKNDAAYNRRLDNFWVQPKQVSTSRLKRINLKQLPVLIFLPNLLKLIIVVVLGQLQTTLKYFNQLKFNKKLFIPFGNLVKLITNTKRFKSSKKP